MPKKRYQLTYSKDLPHHPPGVAMQLVQARQLKQLQQEYSFFRGFWVDEGSYTEHELSLLNELNQLNAEGISVLMLAVQLGEVDIVRFLLDKEVDTSYCNRSGHTALTLAYSLKQANADKAEYNDIFAELLNYMQKNRRKTLLFQQVKVALKLRQEDFEPLITLLIATRVEFFNIAVMQDDVEMMRYLERRHYGLDVPLGKMYDCFKLAAEKGCLAIVEDLVTRYPDLVKRESSNFKVDYPALHQAAYYNQYDIVKYLVDNFPHLLEATDLNSRTVLHDAAVNGHLAVVEYLVTQQPGLNPKRDKDGRIALHYAAWKGHLEVVQYLAQNDPSLIEIETDLKTTILSCAIEGGHLAVADYLTNQYPQLIEKCNKNGDTALHFSVWQGRLDMVRHLVEKQPKLVEMCNIQGNTALHLAAWQGRLDVVGYLIESFPCLLQKKTCIGSTALHLAVFNGWEEVAKVLAQACPSLLKEKNMSNNTPIYYALDKGLINLARFFLKVSQDKVTSQKVTVKAEESDDKEDRASCSHHGFGPSEQRR